MTPFRRFSCPPLRLSAPFRGAAAVLGLLSAGLLVAGLPDLAWGQTAASKPAPAQTGGDRGSDRSNNRSGDHIVAVVNSELVTSNEVQQRLERALAEAQRAGAAAPKRDALREEAMQALIDERVQVTYARDAGSKVDEVELDRAVANVAAQNQLSVPQLRERLRAEGLDYARFRSNLRDQLLVERVREREVVGRIRVGDDEVDQLLAQERAKQGGELKLNLAQILVSVPEGASVAQVAERRARADAAQAQLQAGTDFAAVVLTYSEDANRATGGEIGLRELSRLPDLFADAAKNLKKGDYTRTPLRSAAGFHILKVVDRQEPGDIRVTQTHARHILLRVSEGARPEAVAARLETIRRQIERGERSFEAVARELSEDGSADAGGDLGWAVPGQFVPEFEEAMNKLAPGGISPPVLSRFGVHLLQVIERREVEADPKALREQARNLLREQKFEAAYKAWVKELRLRAYIEMREPPL